jgi:monooxygenase
MFTLGFAFYPWTKRNTIAEGADICAYVKETAAHFGIDKKIQFNQMVKNASWSSKDTLWTLSVEDQNTKESRQLTARFVVFASGYYDYAEGYYPDLPGSENFKGQILKPQFWDENLDYSGKKMVIIGSGATAATLLPNLAAKAKLATLLQRSPTYYICLPSVDPLVLFCRKFLPVSVASAINRTQNQLKSSFFYYMCRLFPNFMRRVLRFLTKRQLPANIPLDPHFSPAYKPWDQRPCIIPNGDMFQAMRDGKASIATGHIETMTANSIKLKSGQEIECDYIVQATGLKVSFLGGANVTIDGKKLIVKDRYVFKGQMMDRVPNLSFSFGYTNASWSLGSDLCVRHVCNLLNYMKDNGYAVAMPVCDTSDVKPAPLMNLDSGYIQRAKEVIPKGGNKRPWQMKTNYYVDLFRLKTESITDCMKFTPAK